LGTIEEIKEEVTKVLVEDYDKLKNLMETINSTLKLIDIKYKYDYDQFCNEILNNLDKKLKDIDNPQLTPIVMNTIINEMIKSKIIEDENHEEKIKNFFENSPDISDVKHSDYSFGTN
jgi:hypothetical protein